MTKQLRNVARSGDEALALVRQLAERCTLRPAPKRLLLTRLKGERELLKPVAGFVPEPKPWQRRFRGVLHELAAVEDIVRVNPGGAGAPPYQEEDL